MSKRIDYYFSIRSPWSYLGHQRFLEIATKHGAEIVPHVPDLAKVFPASGGLPLPLNHDLPESQQSGLEHL